jgi:site-specific recombinase
MIARVFSEYQSADKENSASTIQFVRALIDEIRPDKTSQVDQAVKAIQALCYLLQQDSHKADLLREAILKLLAEHQPVSLLVDSRHSAFSGFFTEMRRRIAHQFLPSAIDNSYLADLFSVFFHQQDDDEWVLEVPNEVWMALIAAISFDKAAPALMHASQKNVFSSIEVLSYRITALGLEPELLKNHPELALHDSPFIAQQKAIAAWLDSVENQSLNVDLNHILVMLDQCKSIIQKIRRNTAKSGTSIHLTSLLQRLTQQVERLVVLIQITSPHTISVDVEIVQLFKQLVYAECHKNDLGAHWQENMEVMALRVTENASRTGEHYITESRAEYFALMRSAMGAGVIIATMAMLKILLARVHFAPLTEAILFGLNYGLGFILIHILHFTVATKQPAMTAAAIAASIDASNGNGKDMQQLVGMIANTARSQLVAIFGNVVIAVPVAMAIAWSVFYCTGEHFISVDKAQHLLADIHPFKSGSFFYAAIAGVCLFLSGLIAGYHDNLAVYNKIPERLKAVRWLKKTLGESRLNRIADYVENNLGALAGNFYFGCLLGGAGAIGVLFGLPFDIRHIAFSSAFVGYAIAGLDFSIGWQTIAWAVAGLAVIGFANLTVSFSLALYVAMKSRKVRFNAWRLLVKNLLKQLNHNTLAFILPPKKELQE